MAYQYLSIAFTVNLAYLSLHSSGIWSVIVLVPWTELFTSSLPSIFDHSPSFLHFSLPLSLPFPHSCPSFFVFLFLSSTLPSFPAHWLTLQFLVHHSSDPFWTILEQTPHNTSSIMLQGQLWVRRNRETWTVKTVATYIQVWEGCSYLTAVHQHITFAHLIHDSTCMMVAMHCSCYAVCSCDPDLLRWTVPRECVKWQLVPDLHSLLLLEVMSAPNKVFTDRKTDKVDIHTFSATHIVP